MFTPVFIFVAVVVIVALFFALFVRWGTRWGATPDERALQMPGDVYLDGGPATRVVMTRAISINAPPEVVWPWLAQLGRGAGWYSYDRLDNGGKNSAWHLVSWIPEPQLGDATAIGYLRHLEIGRELVWWLEADRFFGATLRMVADFRLTPEGEGSRLVARFSADAAGLTAKPVLWMFEFIDSIMARRQLLGLKARAERSGAHPTEPDPAETGARDQYQSYEVIYASGERAGVPRKEGASRWRQAAIEGGVIVSDEM